MSNLVFFYPIINIKKVFKMAEKQPSTMYLRLRKQIKHQRGRPILLAHVAQVLAAGEQLESELKRLRLYQPSEQDGQMLLLDMLQIVRVIKEYDANINIEYYGEPHILIELIAEKISKNRIIIFLMVWVLLFIGSGLAIMNFHADVSMEKVHQNIYKLVTGKENKHPLLLQIPYSIGIGAGMMIFFNRVFRKRLNEEPNPLEVEMFLYQDNVRQYIITEEYQRMNRDDEMP